MKELCKLKKSDLHDRVAEIAQRWDECIFLCKKCGRIAPEMSWLCKPKKVTSSQTESKPSGGKAVSD
jgi:uncharacterized protein YjaG (DUF416 family)